MEGMGLRRAPRSSHASKSTRSAGYRARSMLVALSHATAAPPNASHIINPRLESLDIDIDPAGITISGFSSGAGFALMQQVAFSSVYAGVGAFSGPIPHCPVMYWPNVSELVNGTNPTCPFCDGCPQGTTLKDCDWGPAEIQTARVVHEWIAASTEDLIDDVAHLNGTRVWVHMGSSEGAWAGGQNERNLAQVFEAFGAAIVVTSTPSNHAWPLDGHGTPCGQGKSYIEDCHFDGPGAMLNHLYGPLLPPAKSFDPNGLINFDQRPFFSPDNDGELGAGLASNGTIYLPTRCRATGMTCRLHMSLHGCGEAGYYHAEVWMGTEDL